MLIIHISTDPTVYINFIHNLGLDPLLCIIFVGATEWKSVWIIYPHKNNLVFPYLAYVLNIRLAAAVRSTQALVRVIILFIINLLFPAKLAYPPLGTAPSHPTLNGGHGGIALKERYGWRNILDLLKRLLRLGLITVALLLAILAALILSGGSCLSENFELLLSTANPGPGGGFGGFGGGGGGLGGGGLGGSGGPTPPDMGIPLSMNPKPLDEKKELRYISPDPLNPFYLAKESIESPDADAIRETIENASSQNPKSKK